MTLIPGLPTRDAEPNELVSLDVEMLRQPMPLHIPRGDFACLSIGMGKDVFQVYDTYDLKEALHRIRKGMWTLHNAIYDLRQLRRWVEIPMRPIWDTMLVEKHLFAGYYTITFGLEDLGRRWLGVRRDKSIRDKFSDHSKMTLEMKHYGAGDASDTRRIAEMQMRLQETVSFRSYWEVNMPVIWALLDMPPVRLDMDRWLKIAAEMKERGEELTKELGFNPNSPKQVTKIMEARYEKKFKNTRRVTMEQIGGDPWNTGDGGDAYVKKILQARTYLKLASTYGENWAEFLDENNYIRAGWNADGATTGRMSCSDPNLQNVPVRDFPQYRECFIASLGCKYVLYDANQQEPRVGAFLTRDPKLLEIFQKKESIYPQVAQMMGREVEKGTKEYDNIKKVVLGSFYGLTGPGLAKQQRIPKAEAIALQEKFFETFSGIKPWMDKQRSIAWQKGYVETILGRRLWVNFYEKHAANNAVNSPVQGSAGEMTKLALYNIWKMSQERGLPFLVNLVIHDETNADTPKELVKEYRKLVDEAWHEASLHVIPDIPFVGESAIGSSWGAKK